MINFSIDESKCIKCARCVNDCPGRVIKMSDSKLPFIPPDKQDSCIHCQHCLTVCPAAALSIDGIDPAESVVFKSKERDAVRLASLIRCRRSYRNYKDENLDGGLIKNMLDTAANAPTGVNSRGVRFAVIDDREVMARFRAAAMEKIAALEKDGKIPEQLSFFADFAKKWREKKIDIIFRGAPHMVVTYAPKDCPTPDADCFIALSYFELYAQSLGVGTLWCGMAKWLVSALAPELATALGIGADCVIGYFMLFGRPAVEYARGVQRRAEHVHIVKM